MSFIFCFAYISLRINNIDYYRMRHIYSHGVLIFIGMMASSSLFGQNVPPRLQSQQDAYESGSYMFPAQKRSNWGVGLSIGSAMVAGDVSPVSPIPGYGIGLHVQKALGHAFSLRLQANKSHMAGQNYRSSHGYFSAKNNPWASAKDISNQQYWAGGFSNPKRVYYNYMADVIDVSLQGVFTLNNVNFYKEQSKVGLHLIGGVGLYAGSTLVDAFDDNGRIYDFSPAFAIDKKSDALKKVYEVRGISGGFAALNKKLYDMPSEPYPSGTVIKYGTYLDSLKQKNNRYYTILPMITGGVNVSYRLSRRLDLGIEQRITAMNSDLLDAQRWQENGANMGRTLGNQVFYYGNKALTGGQDVYLNTNLTLTVKLGKGDESLWNTNPLVGAYGKINDMDKRLKSAQEDNDNDGVSDIYDQEPETPEGMEVDSKGRTKDTDEDGIPDSDDMQKNTPMGCDVDNKGVAKDNDGDRVPDCYDLEINTKPGAMVDANGRTIVIPKVDCAECIKQLPPPPPPQIINNTPPIVVENNECDLPSVHFDLDRANVKQEFYPSIFHVARYMINHPNEKIRISGYTDVGGEEIIRKRVESVLNFIQGNFGIDRSRFEIAYGIASDGVQVGNGNSNKNPKTGPMDYLNRRVDFECIK